VQRSLRSLCYQTRPAKEGPIRRTSGGLRLLLLGDAITCPLQLEEPGWHSFGDTDPDVAHQARR
jgi:hypothetical protein